MTIFRTEHGQAIDVDDAPFRDSLEIEIEGREPCRSGWGCCGGCEERSVWLTTAEAKRLADHLLAVVNKADS